jgi:cytoskeletal protein RodZ
MAVNGNGGSRSGAGDARLRSWKEIAAYFGADERTVKRWEVSRGLPVHRVPGEARAPVYAYESELAAWLRAEPGGEVVEAPAPAAAAPRVMPRRRALLFVAAIAVGGLAVVSVQGWQQAASERQTASDRVADVRQLARSQVAALSDRLEKQPGTVTLRAGLAEEAATVLARVAALPDATPELRQEAAEAYRRLAIVQNSTERPSLRDRPAARASLDKALALVAEDSSAAGRQLRARILVDAARQAAADGAVAKAVPMLAEAKASAGAAPPALRDELLLGEAEIADWQGEYAKAIALAEGVAAAKPADAEAALRQLRGYDLAAEGHYYAGNKAAALAEYRQAAAAARAGLARWPDEPRFRWTLQRQQWNVGTTLIDAGRSAEALPMLKESRDGWLAMAGADPEDGAVASWVRVARAAYGQALTGAGQTEAAIAELSASLADRREWLADKPDNAERQRALIIGLQALADAMSAAGRKAEACAMLGEAGGMVQRMTRAGSFTRQDRDSIVPMLEQARARNCPAAPSA